MSHPEDDSRAPLCLTLADEGATLALGRALAGALAPGLVIWLEGALGTGKTTLVRGVLRGLGYAGRVRSPTYTLVEPYAISKLELHHFDFYRFGRAEEFQDAGLDEYFGGAGVCLVEWPDKGAPFVPAPDLHVHFELAGDGRLARIGARSAAGRRCLSALAASLPTGL